MLAVRVRQRSAGCLGVLQPIELALGKVGKEEVNTASASLVYVVTLAFSLSVPPRSIGNESGRAMKRVPGGMNSRIPAILLVQLAVVAGVAPSTSGTSAVAV